jgi:hypothetical protein
MAVIGLEPLAGRSGQLRRRVWAIPLVVLTAPASVESRSVIAELALAEVNPRRGGRPVFMSPELVHADLLQVNLAPVM